MFLTDDLTPTVTNRQFIAVKGSHMNKRFKLSKRGIALNYRKKKAKVKEGN